MDSEPYGGVTLELIYDRTKGIAKYTDILAKPSGDAEIQKNRERLKSPNLGESDKANLRDTLPENRKLVEQKLKDLQKDYPTRLSQDETKQLTEKLMADRQKMAALLFGLPGSQIQFNASSSNDNLDKMINIDPMNPSQTGDISLKNNFTSHFSAQNFSDLIPVHSGLVLTRAATDYFFGHCFKRVRLIADVPGISRHVFISNLEIHIGLIR